MNIEDLPEVHVEYEYLKDHLIDRHHSYDYVILGNNYININ